MAQEECRVDLESIAAVYSSNKAEAEAEVERDFEVIQRIWKGYLFTVEIIRSGPLNSKHLFHFLFCKPQFSLTIYGKSPCCTLIKHLNLDLGQLG
jgi:hypothetical protein